MAKITYLNPSRRKSRKGHRSAAQKRATAKMIAANRRGRVSKNPIRAAAKTNPRRAPARRAPARRAAARRNPIRLGGSPGFLKLGTYLAPIGQALVMGAGAVAVDVGYGFLNRQLPIMLQRTPKGTGLGDLFKALVTVAVGNALRGPTKDLSRKAAVGSLVVQAHQLALTLLPPNLKPGLGFVSPGRIVQGTGRTNSAWPRPAQQRLGQYWQGGTPTLSGVGRYTTGPTPLLSRAAAVRR